MTSSSLLPSKYFDKLQVNRLKANDIKSDNIYPERPSYLFSAVFNNATFDRNESGGILTITKNDIESIIQFSDRPFRQTQNIDFDIFISLFEVTGNNSFEEDPPNGVLTHSEEQRTYIIRLLNSENDKATFSLELLPGETHNLTTISGRMNLFVDDETEFETEFEKAMIYYFEQNIPTIKIDLNNLVNSTPMKDFSIIGAPYAPYGPNSYGFDFNKFEMDISGLGLTSKSNAVNKASKNSKLRKLSKSIKTALSPLVKALRKMNNSSLNQENMNIYKNLTQQVGNIQNMLI